MLNSVLSRCSLPHSSNVRTVGLTRRCRSQSAWQILGITCFCECWPSGVRERNIRSTSEQGNICWRRSEEHTLNSSHGYISYAVFCLKKKKRTAHTSSHERYRALRPSCGDEGHARR